MTTKKPEKNNDHLHERDDDLLCKCTVIHEGAIANVQKEIAGDDMIAWTADLFKVLGDPTRLKIVSALQIEELCVCDISELLDMSQPAISHHLAKLRQARLVKSRRDGKMIAYSLDDEHVEVLLKQGLLHAAHRQ
ncbi:MAG: metalloregulator ArsR/SmtB family transcription factor [Clostridiales Family XIII bacterium]|jgi:ArsR family transcriptional regulator|nr:metalloregulator ArsR/SmtB family transcription factor [Clostridiales Family XIII bacterium]